MLRTPAVLQTNKTVSLHCLTKKDENEGIDVAQAVYSFFFRFDKKYLHLKCILFTLLHTVQKYVI